MLKELFTKYKFILLVLASCLLAVWPLFHPGLIPTHDGEYHLIRFFEFDKTLRSGVLYPRWAPDLYFGYGLPLLTYVYPIPNYVASIFHFLGLSFLEAVKYNMIAATISGGILFFLWSRIFWGNKGALVASVFYTFSPYHFVDIYVRGSVGEVWALGLFPGFLWAYTEFIHTKEKKYIIFSSVFLALTIFSHNILGLMFFTFAVSYMAFLIMKNKKQTLIPSLFIIICSLGFSAIFWMPALFETNYVAGLQLYNIAQNFPDLFQLIFPSWGTNFFGTSLDNQMSVQIGIVNLLVIILTAGAVFISIIRRQLKESSTSLFFLGWFVLLVFCMLPISLPIWKYIPLIHYFQFPWRLLSLVILVCSFLAGSIISGKKDVYKAIILIAFALITTYTYTQPAYYMLRNDRYYTSRPNFIDGTNSPGNAFNTIWNVARNSRPATLIAPNKEIFVTRTIMRSPQAFSLVVSARKEAVLIINRSYFPGWSVVIDNTYTKTFSSIGLLAFTVPRGNHTITVTFGQTTIEVVATILSIATAFSFVIFLRKRM